MTTKADISTWFDRGVEDEASHMLIICDTFDYEDYPVYIKENEDVYKIEEKFSNKNMQKVMEVYNLKTDKETQLNQFRAFNY